MKGPCSSENSNRAWHALSDAAEGFNNLDLMEACSTLLSQIIASGSYTVEDAKSRAHDCGEAMAGDIEANWHLTLQQRKARRS